MNAITQFLLAGAALGALATAPAVAESVPHFGVVALHAGHVVNKTRIRDPNRQHLTYTFGVSTYVPASDLGIETKLLGTYYKWNSFTSGGYTVTCSVALEKLKVPKKSTYAKLGKGTVTYSFGCPSPTVFYGDTYKLTDPAGEGRTDNFVSTLIGKFNKYTYRGTIKYRGTLHLDVSVSIGK